MTKVITNHDIDAVTWMSLTRAELNALAKKNNIGIPSHKFDLADNLQRGYSDSQTEIKTFKVRLSV